MPSRPVISRVAVVALMCASFAAHAARNDRVLLILPEGGALREQALAIWNDEGIGMGVDMVVDPALGTDAAAPGPGMRASIGEVVPGTEWVILPVSQPGELAAALDSLPQGDFRIAAMGPFDAFADNPAEAYAQIHAVIMTTPPLPDDGERAAFVARTKIVAAQSKGAQLDMLLGLALEPDDGDDPLMAAMKLFVDTRDYIGIFAVDVPTHGEYALQLAESVATAPAPRARGMYTDMMQRPENILDPQKEVWMQRAAMVLGVFTILGVAVIVRLKKPGTRMPPQAG